jgi:hypothetical protein
MNYLVFDTYQDAYVANATISMNMRLSGNVTQQWSDIRQRLDGKFVLLEPESLMHMQYVQNYIDIQEYSEEWFPQSEDLR